MFHITLHEVKSTLLVEEVIGFVKTRLPAWDKSESKRIDYRFYKNRVMDSVLLYVHNLWLIELTLIMLIEKLWTLYVK